VQQHQDRKDDRAEFEATLDDLKRKIDLSENNLMVARPWKRSRRFIERSRRIEMSRSIATAKAKFVATRSCSAAP